MFPGKVLTVVAFLISSGLAAQEVVIYYNASWQPVKSGNAVYISSVVKKDSLWRRVDYYVSTRKTAREGWYNDAAATIRHGELLSFYLNGQLESRRSYRDNLMHGASFSYYPNGMMRDSFYFIRDVPSGLCTGWYPSGSIMVEMQMDSTGNGSGLAIGFFEDGSVSFKGKMGRGLRKTGNWFYYHTNGNRASVLQFPQEDNTGNVAAPQVTTDNFERTYYDSTVTYQNALCFDLNGVQQTPCTIINKVPVFQKGGEGWTQYLETQLYPILPKISQFPTPLRYTAVFTVGTDGKPGEVELDTKIDPSLDRDIRLIFQNAKKWVPATHNNRLLPYIHFQALTLGGNP
jgi:hypothetical protein